MIPALAMVPSTVGADLLIKASSSGVVYLKDGRYRSRYTGNKYSAVDINGNLWLKKSDLKKAIQGPGYKPVKKKKPTVETAGSDKEISIISNYEEQSSANLSTSQTEIQSVIDIIPTKKPAGYSVNKKEVRQRILGYINTQKGRKELYFWTVTFPKGLPDAAAYKIYNHWLTALRQWKMLKEYIWVAERQQNGTIHFHVAIPHRMPVKRGNAMMGGILKGYARRGEIGFPAHYFNKYNGVDIAKNRKTKRVTNFAIKKGSRALVTYLTKYITKNDGSFEHLAWHNSRGYSGIFTGVTFTVKEFRSNGLYQHLDPSKKFEGEFFVFVPWKGDPPRKLMQCLFQLNTYLQAVGDGDIIAPKMVQCSVLGNLVNLNYMRYNKELTGMSYEQAEQQVLSHERQMLRAFVLFCGEYSFCREFSDNVRFRVLVRVASLGMMAEFSDLIALIDKEHDAAGFSFLYHLYCYWAVDLLNQIPNN